MTSACDPRKGPGLSGEEALPHHQMPTRGILGSRPSPLAPQTLASHLCCQGCRQHQVQSWDQG